MVSQAFFYNAVFFTYALILNKFYGVAQQYVGLYIIPFAAGNFLGALILGRFFDTIGRKPMIIATYTISSVLLIVTGILFITGSLNAITQAVCWSIVFFFSSAGASAAYLTIAEIFPLEIRAIAISFFFSIGTAGGGLLGPILFGALIETQNRVNIFYGYLVGAIFMLCGAVSEYFWGVKAERLSLEQIAAPISSFIPTNTNNTMDSSNNLSSNYVVQ